MRLVRRKSRKPEASKLELERVIGLTTSNANGLASNPATGDIVYLAGCVVVVYNVKTNSQTKFLTSPKNHKAFSCVAYSYSGGKYIAAGETGHQPAVVLWEAATGSCVGDLRTHKYGVSCVEFSPNGKYLLSVGVPHDGFLCLWDWKGGVLLIKTRSTAATLLTSSVHFSSDGHFFVSGGTKHLKHWTIGGQGQGGRARSAGGLGTIAVEGRPVKLGSQMSSSFVAVSCARPLKDNSSDTQPLYALTTAGVLCLLHCGVAVEKWVDLRVRRGYGLAVSETHIACACSDGIVRVFMQGSLAYAATMPRPAPYGFHGLTDGNAGMVLAMGQRLQPGIKFPDAVACQFLHEGQKLAVIYGDHSLFVWDVRSFAKIGKYRAFLSHSGCIWDVKTLPTCQWESTEAETDERDISGGAIATCSADGSIRLWNMSNGEETESLAPPVSDVRPANIYSKELLGVLYLDPTAELKDKATGSGSEDEFVDTAQGFRSICASPDGLHLAAGDRSGNLRIFDLETMKLISFQEAHDAEILSLSFTAVMEDKNLTVNKECEPPFLLASGGRDRLIHVYDARRDYDVIETLDDHSASITAVKFGCNGSKLLSCSADKSVVFRNVVSAPTCYKSVRYHQEVAPRGTIHDLDVDASEKFVVTVGQDKKINVLNLASGKPVRCFKPEGDAGEAIKVEFDPSGAYVVCSHADKCIRIYEFSTGEVVAQAAGHSEIVTGVTFMPNCRRLISVSGDTCIFVWKLPVCLTRAIRKGCATQAELSPQKSRNLLRSSKNPLRNLRLSRSVVPVTDSADELSKGTADLHDVNADFEPKGSVVGFEAEVFDNRMEEATTKELGAALADDDQTPTFKFSISRLPPWAQAKVAQDIKSGSGGKNGQDKEKSPFQASFESRWAERLGSGGYKLFSEFMEELTPPATIRPSEFGTRRRFTLEGVPTTTMNSQSTPGSVSSQQSDSSTKTSPCDPPRKETVWKTVHTVFFDELDFPEDEFPGKHGLLVTMTATNDERRDSQKPLELEHRDSLASTISPESSQDDVSSRLARHKQSKVREDEEDGVVVYLSDTEVETVIIETQGPQRDHCVEEKDEDGVFCGAQPLDTPLEAPVCNQNKEGLEVFAVLRLQEAESCDVSRRSSICSHASAKKVEEEGVPRVSSSRKSSASDDDDGRSDDVGPLSPVTDHIDARLGDLSASVLVKMAPTSTARRSFSSRFFANSSSTLPRLSLFPSKLPDVLEASVNDTTSLLQDDDVDTNPGRLLAAERERLKLRERQDKMAVEVQRMRERLVNLGIAVAEIANEAEPFESRRGAGDERQFEQTSPVSETPDCMPSASPSLVQDFNNERVSSIQTSTTTPLISSSSSHNVNATPSVFSFAQFCKLPSFPRKLHCGKDGPDEKAFKAEKNTSASFLREGGAVASTVNERCSGTADTCHEEQNSGPNISLITSGPSDSGLRSGSQPLINNNHSGSQPSAGLQNSPLQSTSLSFVSVEDNLSSGESCAATFHGNSPKEEIVEMTVTCTGAGWDFSPMKLTNHEEGVNVASSGSEISEQEVEQNGASCPPSEATTDSPLSEPAMPIYLPRCKQVSNPVEDYKIALQELVEAADRASLLFDQVRSARSGPSSSIALEGVHSTSQKLLPKAFEKVQKLAQEACPFHSLNSSASTELSGRSDMPMSAVTSSDQCFLFQRTSGNEGGTSFSRPQTGVSIASESLSTVDIDSFIDRYSTRFSQTLASQVLALVQRGLNEAKPS